MKKWTSVFLTLFLLFGLSACSQSTEKAEDTKEQERRKENGREQVSADAPKVYMKSEAKRS